MIDKIFPETLKILKNLVKFQTISGMPNLELIEYCEKKLTEVGATSFKTFNKSKNQANLFSTISGKDNWENYEFAAVPIYEDGSSEQGFLVDNINLIKPKGLLFDIIFDFFIFFIAILHKKIKF